MNKTLLICDNRDTLNWGCRATSIALGQLLQQRSLLQTTNRAVAAKEHPVFGFGQYATGKHIANKLAAKALKSSYFNVANRWSGGHADYIANNPAVSVKRFLKAAVKDRFLAEIKSKFEESDKVVINGEGSLIFRSPPRRDLNFQMFAIELADTLGKEVYFVNAMASECPKTPVNKEVQHFVISTLSKCTAVANRDPLSAQLLSGLGLNNVKWYPDALFTWVDRYSDFLNNARITNYPQLFDVWPESNQYFKNWSLWPEEYVCISGASRPPGVNPKDWAAFFSQLAVRMEKEVGLPIVFIDPSGDGFLQNIAIQTNSFFIRPSLQLLLGAGILAKAKVYISGRFHPSILASLSGTPCIFFGSNSHKTLSLQQVLEYPEQNVFDFSVEKENMDSLIEAIKDNVDNSETYRARIRNTVAKRSREAKAGLLNCIFGEQSIPNNEK